MTLAEDAALVRIAASSSEDDLRAYMKNARGKSPKVFRAALERLVEVSAGVHDDPVALACWKMVHTIEQIRREHARAVWRMNRLRPKIEREGERAALRYCAMNHTDGFEEVLGYGLPQYTAEAIVLGYPDDFPDDQIRDVARNRLLEAGVDPGKFEGKPLA